MASLLTACSSDIYFDRRETIALGGGDAVAANAAMQTVDPWPRNSSNNNLTFDGKRMAHAVECYRYNAVTPPADIDPTVDATSLVPPPQPATCDTIISSSNAAQNGSSQSNNSQSSNGGSLGALMNSGNR